ncbi:MAG: hypothetical protein HYU37_09120 [Acidobacteria bacterium]|nr:hypothetical protein [Acidobacteriota bacterium]
MKPFIDVRLATLVVVAVPLFAEVRQSPSAADVSKPGSEAGRRAGATEVRTDHLKLTSYQSEPAIAPGRRVSLILEIEPAPRMHVYAPGADNYRIITLAVKEQRFVRLAPVQYPVPEVYVFEPLDERIPVYQKPFTLSQEVTLDARPEAQAAFRGRPSLTFTGTLDYQACDDKLCFNPVSVPLSWMLALEPGPTERPSRPPAPRQ